MRTELKVIKAMGAQVRDENDNFLGHIIIDWPTAISKNPTEDVCAALSKRYGHLVWVYPHKSRIKAIVVMAGLLRLIIDYKVY